MPKRKELRCKVIMSGKKFQNGDFGHIFSQEKVLAKFLIRDEGLFPKRVRCAVEIPAKQTSADVKKLILSLFQMPGVLGVNFWIKEDNATYIILKDEERVTNE